jgi:hypothetical protein
MSNRFLITVATAALIAGTGFANAQGTGMGRDAGSPGSTTQQSAPSDRGGGASGGTMQRDSGGTTGMKGAESEKPMGAERNQRADDKMKGGKDMKAEGKEDRGGMKSEQKAEQKSEKSQTTGQGMQRDQSTTQRDQTQRDQTQGRDQMQNRDQKAQGQQDRTQTQTQGGAAGQSTTTTTGQAGAGGKLSTEQRTQITSVIKEQRVSPVTNVNFSISVGTRVPRDVTFHTLPERVVTIYPEWRRYKFILVKEQIVIVDPNTYEIVAILES